MLNPHHIPRIIVSTSLCKGAPKMKDIVFFDTEINPESGDILDIGAVRSDGQILHTARQAEFAAFVRDCQFICGHNIFKHDLKYVGDLIRNSNPRCVFIDTLPLSPLLFPKRPYHNLLKDDKLQTEELNNPLNDAKKAKNLFYDEVNAFSELPSPLRSIFLDCLETRLRFLDSFIILI